MKILGIIPSRYASTRLPAKPLVMIKGKSMVQRVYEQVSKSKLLSKVIVATDHQEIYDHVLHFGGDVCMTRMIMPVAPTVVTKRLPYKGNSMTM